MNRISLVSVALVVGLSTATIQAEKAPQSVRPVHTYSIVARDHKTGEMGVAVQTHYFGVGSRVVWAEPGIGVVATQSFVDPEYGPLGLTLMRAGKNAGQALAALLAADAGADVRQVGMVDGNGNVANHTGENSIGEYCDIAGDQYTVQANLMWKSSVCQAMSRAYETAPGDLAERMVIALEAAQGEGGDIRGQQSAAIVVVSGDRSESAWGGRIFDLRVEDSAEPLKELRRLIKVARAYRMVSQGDAHMAMGEFEKAKDAYRSANELLPHNHELVFWYAILLAAHGEVDNSLPLFSKAFEMWPLWRELVKRMPAAGLIPDDPELMQRIISVD